MNLNFFCRTYKGGSKFDMIRMIPWTPPSFITSSGCCWWCNAVRNVFKAQTSSQTDIEFSRLQWPPQTPDQNPEGQLWYECAADKSSEVMRMGCRRVNKDQGFKGMFPTAHEIHAWN